MTTSTIMLNLFALEKLPVKVTSNLHRPNVVVFTNTHGRVLGVGNIDEPLVIPKGAHKAVCGPLMFPNS